MLIVNPLSRLTHMIHDIAEGEGDVTKRLEEASAFGNDELGEVSRLFNLFLDKLQRTPSWSCSRHPSVDDRQSASS